MANKGQNNKLKTLDIYVHVCNPLLKLLSLVIITFFFARVFWIIPDDNCNISSRMLIVDGTIEEDVCDPTVLFDLQQRLDAEMSILNSVTLSNFSFF